MQQSASHQPPTIPIEQQQFLSIPSDFREQCIRVASRGDDCVVSSLNPNIEWLIDRSFQWIIQHIPVAISSRANPRGSDSSTIPQEQQCNDAPNNNNDTFENTHQLRVVAVVAVLLARFIRAIVGTHQHTFTHQQQQDGEDIIIIQSAVQILRHVVTDVTQLINSLKSYETRSNRIPTFEKLIQNFILPWLHHQLGTDDQLDIPISKMTRWTPLLRLFAIALEYSKRSNISSTSSSSSTATTANSTENGEDNETRAKNSCPKPFFRLLQMLFETTIEASNQSCISYQDFTKVWNYLREKTTTTEDGTPSWMDTIIGSIPGEIPGIQYDNSMQFPPERKKRQQQERHLLQVTWKLSCFWFHHLQSQEMLRASSSSSGSSTNGNHMITNWKVPSAETIRHQRLLCSAATIGFVALLSFFLLPPPLIDNSNNENEPALKRQKLANSINPTSDKNNVNVNPSGCETDLNLNKIEGNSSQKEQQPASPALVVTPENILQHLQDGANTILNTSHLPNADAILKFEVEAMTKFVTRAFADLESEHHRQRSGNDERAHIFSNLSYVTSLPELNGNLIQLIMTRLRMDELIMRKNSPFLKQVNKILVSIAAATHESKQSSASSSSTAPVSVAQPEDPIITICKLSHKVVWYLPTLIDIIYNRYIMAQYASMDLLLHCVPFVDDTSLPSYDSLDIFSEKFRNPTLTKLLSKLQSLTSVDENHPKIRSLTPPIITESMELNEWIVSIMFIQHVKPCQRLMIIAKNLYGDPRPLMEKMIVPILNGIIHQCNFTGPTGTISTSNGTLLNPITITSGGVVEVRGGITNDVLFCKAVIALYYHSLEAMLLEESTTKRLQALDITKERFHRAILCCCLLAVTRAIMTTKKFVLSPNLCMLNIFSIVHVTECSPCDLLLVSNRFIKAVTSDQARLQLGSPIVVGFPQILIFDFQQIETNIMDSLVWSRGIVSLAEPSPYGRDRTLPYIIEEIRLRQRHSASTTDEPNGTNLMWPPPPLLPTVHGEKDDEAMIRSRSKNNTLQGNDIDNGVSTVTDDEIQYVTEIIHKLLKLVYHRITTICGQLCIPEELPISFQVWLTCRYLLRHHIEILYDRHVDHIILCSLYGVLKAINYVPVITFSNIMEAHIAIRHNDLGEATCHKIFSHIQLTSSDDGNAETTSGVGNIITLYNEIFLPTMHDYITHSPSLIRCISQMKRTSGSSKLAVLHVTASLEQRSDSKSAVHG